MSVEISPQPSEEERRAILAALELEAEEAAPPSPWRAAGFGPGAGDDEDDQAGTPPPRHSRGATRA